jgi:hypothetical protein
MTAWAVIAGAILQFVLGIPMAHLEAETPPSAMVPTRRQPTAAARAATTAAQDG